MVTNEKVDDGDCHIDIVSRKTRQEAIISSFIAENSLSFSLCPKLIELAQEFSTSEYFLFLFLKSSISINYS